MIHVTDPRTGIPGASQWLPTIADVRHACELEMRPLRDAHRRQREREAAERVLTNREADRGRRRTLSELIDRYPDIVGKSKRRSLTDAEKSALYADLESRKSEFRAPLEPSDRLGAAINDGDAA